MGVIGGHGGRNSNRSAIVRTLNTPVTTSSRGVFQQGCSVQGVADIRGKVTEEGDIPTAEHAESSADNDLDVHETNSNKAIDSATRRDAAISIARIGGQQRVVQSPELSGASSSGTVRVVWARHNESRAGGKQQTSMSHSRSSPVHDEAVKSTTSVMQGHKALGKIVAAGSSEAEHFQSTVRDSIAEGDQDVSTHREEFSEPWESAGQWEPSNGVEPGGRAVGALRPLSRTIHILGHGPMGQYIAHCLASLPNPPPVTLLLHRPLLIQQWLDEGQTIRLLKNGKIFEETGVRIESSAPFKLPRQEPVGIDTSPEDFIDQSESIIDHLVVTTRGPRTLPALQNIKHRLRPHSTICFISDGLGIVEEVNSAMFPRALLRPNYVLGSLTHDLESIEEAKFAVIEKYTGQLSMTMLARPPPPPRTNSLVDGPLVRMIDYGWSSSTATSTYLTRVLTRASDLNAVGLSLEDYLEIHLEKLAVNAVLGPISVLFDCSNNQLLSNYQASRTMTLLLEEISLILRSLPESRSMPDPDYRFGVERLESTTLSAIVRTGNNITAMLRDVRQGTKTSVDYYNGYLALRASEMGIACPHNDMLVSMVKAKQAIRSREKNMYIPFVL